MTRFLPLFLFATAAYGQPLTLNDPVLLVDAGGGTTHTPDTLAWKAAVIANGGTAPTEATLTAADTYDNSVAGIKTHLKYVLLIPPDSLIAAETPYFNTVSGSNPSTGSQWSGTLSTTGISAAVGSTLQTGINPTSVFSTANMGLSIYQNVPGAPWTTAFGGGNGATCAQIWGTSATYYNASYSAWTVGPVTPGVATSAFLFVSANRTGTTAYAAYHGSGSIAFTTGGTSTATSGAVPSGTGTSAIGLNSAGVCAGTSSGIQVSYLSVHDGLSSADAQTEFNAATVFRQAMGGGD